METPPSTFASAFRIGTAFVLIRSRKPYRVYSFSPVAIGMLVIWAMRTWPS